MDASINMHCQCDRCKLAFHVHGMVNTAVYEAISKPISCPRCPGTMDWQDDEVPVVPYRSVTADVFYGIIMCTEPLGERPDPKTIAALLTTYRIEKVLLNGPGIAALLLESGQTVELGISRWGPYVTRIVKGVDDG